MGEALETLIALVKSLRLQEIKGKPEVFSFYLGIKIPTPINGGRLINDTPLMFIVDLVDNGKNILAFDMFLLGKANAKRLYEVFKPYANLKNMDMETYKELRNTLLKEFPAMMKGQILKKYPFQFFHSVYTVPNDKILQTIEKVDVLYSLVR